MCLTGEDTDEVHSVKTHTHKSPNTLGRPVMKTICRSHKGYVSFLNIGSVKAALNSSKQDTAVTHTQAHARNLRACHKRGGIATRQLECGQMVLSLLQNELHQAVIECPPEASNATNAE